MTTRPPGAEGDRLDFYQLVKLLTREFEDLKDQLKSQDRLRTGKDRDKLESLIGGAPGGQAAASGRSGSKGPARSNVRAQSAKAFTSVAEEDEDVVEQAARACGFAGSFTPKSVPEAPLPLPPGAVAEADVEVPVRATSNGSILTDRTQTTSEEPERRSGSHGPERHSGSDAPTPRSKSKRARHSREEILRNWYRIVTEAMQMNTHFHTSYQLRSCWSSEEHGGQKGSMASFTSSGLLVADDCMLNTWHSVEHTGRRQAVLNGQDMTWKLGEQEEYHAYMIHPCSTFRLLWVLSSLFFLFCDVFVLSMSVFDMQRSQALDFIDSIYWTVDVGVNFRSGVLLRNGNLCMNPSAVARSYITSWFPLDLTTVLIQWCLVLLDSNFAEAKFIRYLRFVRCVKLVRLAKLDRLVHNMLDRVGSLWADLSAKMALYMLSVFFWVHLSACAWYWVGSVDETGWVKQKEVLTLPLNYFVALHWAASQLQGNVDVYPSNLVKERAFAVTQLLLSVVVLAGMVSKLTTVLQTVQEETSKRRRLLDAARVFCQYHDIHRDLSMRVRKYLARTQSMESRQVLKDGAEVLQALPKTIRRELLREARSPIMCKNLFFLALNTYCSRLFERICCDVLQSTLCMPSETIFSHGCISKAVYFVLEGETMLTNYTFMLRMLQRLRERQLHGESDTSPSGREHRNLPVEEHTCLCEATLWVQWVHCGDFEAQTQATLLLLDCGAFEELIGNYVTAVEVFTMHAARVVRALNFCDEPSDLFDSLFAMQAEDETLQASEYNVNARSSRRSSRPSLRVASSTSFRGPVSSPSMFSINPATLWKS